MTCGIIMISESVTLLSSRVIYGIIVINKSIICIIHTWEILITSQAICGMSTISANVRLLLEERDVSNCNKAFLLTIWQEHSLEIYQK